MKSLFLPILLACMLLIGNNVNAQSPQLMNYQAVARDKSGNILSSQTISLRMSITNGSTTEYVETFSGVSTNAYGMFSIQVGNGSVVSGTVSGIKWSTGSHYLKVEMDPSNGTSYANMGTSQLVAVPFSFYSDKAGSADLSKSNLSDLGDVSGTPTKGQTLKWNGSAWTPANDSVGSSSTGTSSQWTTSGSDIYYNLGKVLVNATGTPLAQMEVYGTHPGATALGGRFIADSGSSFTVGMAALGENSNATNNRGIEAIADGGSTYNTGLFASTTSSGSSNSNYGVLGYATGTGTQTYGVLAEGDGSATYNIGLLAAAGTSGTTNYAGYFNGDVYVNGTLGKSAGSFKIDNPMNPANEYLVHSFVESPDMMNVYNGNITTDANGDALVTLPDYFMVLNKDFRYQLTVMGTFAQAIVFEKVKDNHFKIKTDKPNVEVSWQVTGIRQDPYAVKHPIIPVVEKTGVEKGRYLAPDLYGKPASMGMLIVPSKQVLEKSTGSKTGK